ncbi:gliding motility lipoprotein GldH [Daejeonella sp.]|uniref:gliding motility lipoprotein GldH n=1 Tax=Daejeonella sp. TaxID=2805397 RepID=UPI0030BE67FE
MGIKGDLILLIFLSVTGFTSCQDTQTVVDNNIEIAGHNWSYTEKVQVPVMIENVDLSYNLYVNLRLTSRYKYSNIFLLIHITGPDGKKTTERKEFRVARPDGEWLGSGSGNLYSYQMPFKENYRFPAKGKYVIELEQNMRDNPLNSVTDAGVRVEKAN